MADKPGVLRNLRIKRVALVDKGANLDAKTGDGAHIMLYKRDLNKDAGLAAVHVSRPIGKDGDTEEQYGCPCPDCDGADIDDYEKATLDAESRSKIPDSKFLAVWTDAQGNKHRKLPINDAGHIAAARGRIDGAKIPDDVKAAARRKLEHLTSTKEKNVAKTFKDVFAKLSAAFAETDVAKRTVLLKEAEADAEAIEPPKPGSDEHEQAEQQHINALQNLHKTIGGHLKKMGAGPHPDGHPYHKMKAMREHLGKMLKSMGCEVESDEPGGLAGPSEHVTKALTALEKSNNELRTQLGTEIEKRLDGEMLTVLKSFKATPFKLEGADSDVKKFRKMKQDDPSAYERMMELFKAADAQLATSDIFKSFGAGGSAGPGSAYAEAEAMADKLMEKSAYKELSREQAIEKVFEQNPKLYSRYVAEQQ